MEAVIKLALSDKIEVQNPLATLRTTRQAIISLKAKFEYLITTIEESAVLIISPNYIPPA